MWQAILRMTLCGLLIGSGLVFADDLVKVKLDAAKATYEREMKKHRKEIDEWLEKQEEAARKEGKKASVDEIKTERQDLEEFGYVPPAAPKHLKDKFLGTYHAMDSAYKTAIKRYLDAKSDQLADEATKSHTEFRAAYFVFDGTWRISHSSGWKGERRVKGRRFVDGSNAKWTLDGTTLMVRWPDGGWEKLTVNPDEPDKLLGGRGDAIKVTWVRVKPKR